MTLFAWPVDVEIQVKWFVVNSCLAIKLFEKTVNRFRSFGGPAVNNGRRLTAAALNDSGTSNYYESSVQR